MALTAHNSISITNYGKRGWRVRCFHMPADWNAMSRTIVEQFCRTEASAWKLAKRLSTDHNAQIL